MLTTLRYRVSCVIGVSLVVSVDASCHRVKDYCLTFTWC